MFTDLPLAEMQTYLPDRNEPADFDAFWADSIAAVSQFPLNARFSQVETYLKAIDSFDVEFAGYGGQTIRGWLNVPHERSGPLPCVVEYIGYGGGRGIPQDWLLYSAAGYAHFVMDSRGQGGAWRTGDTPDMATMAPHFPGFTTLGINSPHDHYYRRLYVDAVRAVAAARTSDLVDPDRIAVAGNSQGGGTAIAAAGLAGDLVAVLPGVPFMCHISRAIRITDALPYFEITSYLRANPLLRDRALHTLSYFDGMNFAARASAPALFSVALMDQTCPPSTVFAAYNHYAGPKDIRVWEFNDHDGAEPQQAVEILRFLAGRTAPWCVTTPTASNCDLRITFRSRSGGDRTPGVIERDENIGFGADPFVGSEGLGEALVDAEGPVLGEVLVAKETVGPGAICR